MISSFIIAVVVVDPQQSSLFRQTEVQPKLGGRFVIMLLALLCSLLTVSARIPRASGGLGAGLGASHRLQGAGLHHSASTSQPRGMEDLSWWPTSSSSPPQAATRGGRIRPSLSARAGPKGLSFEAAEASSLTNAVHCMLTLTVATVLWSLSTWVELLSNPSSAESRYLHSLVFADGKPTALMV